MAIKFIKAIKSANITSIRFLITTHHALFYNILINEFNRWQKRNKNERLFEPYILSKINQSFELKEQNSDSPFAYHLLVKETIQYAINTNAIERFHFNLFRGLLEKTANFLGYNNWSDCIIEDDNKEELKQRLQLYSHSKLSDLESRELSIEDKKILQETFTAFLEHFKWKT